MTHKAPGILVCLLGIVLCAAAPAAGQELLTLNLENIPAGVVCDQVWYEQGVALSFTTTTAEDCDMGGNCSFGVYPGEPVWLFPSRLVADFGAPYVVFRVEIDVIDWCGIGCTRLFLYDDAGGLVGSVANGASSTPQILVVDLGAGSLVRSVAVSSCEGNVLSSSIRVYSQVLEAESSSWGRIKANYR
jgi:hypothetical protein